MEGLDWSWMTATRVQNSVGGHGFLLQNIQWTVSPQLWFGVGRLAIMSKLVVKALVRLLRKAPRPQY